VGKTDFAEMVDGKDDHTQVFVAPLSIAKLGVDPVVEVLLSMKSCDRVFNAAGDFVLQLVLEIILVGELNNAAVTDLDSVPIL
jgi:hypothetical protein